MPDPRIVGRDFDHMALVDLDGVPAPPRTALEVALLRAEPSGPPPEPRAIALGLLNVLRALSAAEPLVVAIDDIQWLDGASAEALAFAARRQRPTGELTPTEERVVALAAEGMANKEIARTLYVTVHTVEVHLSRACAKLGVRKRSQLAGRLAEAKQ